MDNRWRIAVGRVLGLTIAVGVTLLSASPADRLVVGAALAVCSAGAVYAWWYGQQRWTHRLAGLAVMGAAAVVVFAVDADSPGWLLGGVVVAAGLVRLPQRVALALALAMTAALVAVPLARGTTDGALGVAAGCAGFAVLGLIMGGARSRAEDAERLLASDQAARAAEAEAERYAERQHLAREIHDVLAHTLAAQAVQLEGARLLLARGAPPEETRARIEAAQRLARDGLEETRRAVLSLRGQRPPLAETVRALAGAAGAGFGVEGAPRAMSPHAALAVERTVQEALTNARKHAPGAAVTVTLRFGPDRDEVEVRDSGATRDDVPLAGVGAGYGLTGMRERAEMIGGRLTAEPFPVGPDGKGFRVWLVIPRQTPSAS